MRTGRTVSSCGHGVGGMALAGLTVLTAACASGGGALPLTEADAETLLSGLTGVWAVDESSSEMPNWDIQSVGTAIHFEDMEQARREAVRRSEEETQRLMAVLEPIFSVAQPWSTLILRVDEERLVFVPTPGRSLELPMSGEWIEWIEQILGRHPIRTRVYWDGDSLALEHRPRSGGQVRSVLEIMDGRLQITTRIRVLRTSLPPSILVYDRDEAGGR
ncbi:MAG: hypothetical protein OXL34_03315 [Gemmatimonadota bacterium]|nr:hypothetical protein [Gemmatimonadota bacterium]